MSFIRRFWIIEITLGLIALAALAIGLFGMPSLGSADSTTLTSAPVATPTLVSNRDAINAVQQMSNAEPDEDDDEFADDEDEMAGDDDFAADESGEDEMAEGDEFDLFDALSAALGMETDAMFQAWMSGQTPAELAAAAGVDISRLTQTLVEQEQAFIASELAAGFIDADEAEEWSAEVALITPFMIETGYSYPEMVAARTIGIDLEAFFDAYDGGTTIADLANSNGVDPMTVSEAILQAENSLVDMFRDANLISQEDAAEWRSENRDMVVSLVNQPIDHTE